MTDEEFEEELKRVVAHEAGHAACYAFHGLPVRKVEIRTWGFFRRSVAGRCWIDATGSWPPYNWRAEAQICCAGYAAETLIFGTVDKFCCQADFKRANRILADNGSAISLEFLCDETIRLLRPHMRVIMDVADALLVHRRL